jgi:hypothetical protein
VYDETLRLLARWMRFAAALTTSTAAWAGAGGGGVRQDRQQPGRAHRRAIALFSEKAPDVQLQMHVAASRPSSAG